MTKERPASTLFDFLACGMDFSLQRNNLTANVANVKYVRFLPFLLHLAAFLATGMGFFVRCHCKSNSVVNGYIYYILSTSLSLHSAGFLPHGMDFFQQKLTANVTNMTYEWLSSKVFIAFSWLFCTLNGFQSFL